MIICGLLVCVFYFKETKMWMQPYEAIIHCCQQTSAALLYLNVAKLISLKKTKLHIGQYETNKNPWTKLHLHD